jgi:hypothetical protein
MKTPIIDSYGIGTTFCKWFLQRGESLRNDIVFYPIIRTPKATKGFRCEFRAFFKIGHPQWKSSGLFLKDPITVDVGN